MPSPLLSLFKSYISITHLQTHHAKKLAIYQACIIQPQLETSTGRGGEWARLTKKSNSEHKQSNTHMKKPQSKVQTQGKSNIKCNSRAENARESNQYLLPHHTRPTTNLWIGFGCKTHSFLFYYAKTISFSFFRVQALPSNDAWTSEWSSSTEIDASFFLSLCYLPKWKFSLLLEVLFWKASAITDWFCHRRMKDWKCCWGSGSQRTLLLERKWWWQRWGISLVNKNSHERRKHKREEEGESVQIC